VVQKGEEPKPSNAHPRATYAIKEVLSVLDEEPLFGTKELQLYRWIAHYYIASLGEVLRTALPLSMNLRSYRAVRILPQGMLALRAGMFLTRQEEQILLRLERTGSIALKNLQKNCPVAAERWIQSLEEKGYIERCQIFRGQKKGSVLGMESVHLCLSPSSPPPQSWLELLPGEQSRIIEHLLEGAPSTVKDLEEAFPGAKSALSSLQEKGIVVLRATDGGLTEYPVTVASGSSPFHPTPQQQKVVDQMIPLLQQGVFHSFLLHGVTGSGKTEVYLRVIEEALKQGKEALVLVPEIALTPQTLQRFSSRFGTEVTVLHSRLTERERLDSWWRIRRGQTSIAIGVRSAVFSPFQNLGVIVVDEEHDPSYKQQDGVRYNARDVALVRGKREKAVVILGSATPSLESYYNVQQGKNTLLELRERIQARPLPKMQDIDMRDPVFRTDTRGSLSLPLERALRETRTGGKTV
jgi:primosomal protein N' (replication factor Y)